MKAVGAGFGYGVYDGAAEFPIFGVKAVGYEAKFLDRVQIRHQASAQVASLTDVAAIHQESVGGLTLPVHGNIAGVQTAGYRTVLLDGFGGAGRNARLQAQQIDEAAAIQREGEHLLRVDNVAKLRVFRLYLHGIGFHLDHFLLRGADLESCVDLQLVIDLHNDVCLFKRPEASGGNRESVVADREREHAVRSVRGGDGFLLEISLHVGRRDARTGDGRLGLVANHALNRTGDIGAQNGRAKKCYEYKCKR